MKSLKRHKDVFVLPSICVGYAVLRKQRLCAYNAVDRNANGGVCRSHLLYGMVLTTTQCYCASTEPVLNVNLEIG